ncbi:nitrate reductase NapD [Rhizobium sp. BK529]|uniref:chaperone NapD n=1 Tax=unclassified Rhizobium TaxID=2613769 RepID=UPI00104C5983|nr:MULTISPECIES: chaperone NapD [unclassified Rhizobium]MBB3590786.1 nitrate reductase NapD [Rhizobium sp. BK529]TCS09260.1 periplasmic nitrate reductase chaperone NapD [Rhizobium sp. BK418]
MSDSRHHVSSAVVVTRPELTEDVAARLAAIEGVEVHATGAGKIVIVIEGPHSSVLGETLIGISAMDGVLAAHMVFEQALEMKETIDDDRTHAA